MDTDSVDLVFVSSRRPAQNSNSSKSSTPGSGRTSTGSAPKRGNPEELAKVREWAKAAGYEVSSRGRISQAVRDAYDAAH